MAAITYLSPVAGAVAPSKAQAHGHNEVSARVVVALYDSSVTITHNMQISTDDIADGFPEVHIEPENAAAYSAAPYVSTYGTNTVVITLSDPGPHTDAPTFVVRVRRPWSKTT